MSVNPRVRDCNFNAIGNPDSKLLGVTLTETACLLSSFTDVIKHLPWCDPG